MSLIESERSHLSSICEIRPFLFIARFRAISDKKLKEFGITHIVDATNDPKIIPIPSLKYLIIKIDDEEKSDITKYFVEVANFIQNSKNSGGKILVYCSAGISRSASMCIMYLVIHEGMTLRDSYNHLKSVRSIIYPNLGFWHQMIKFEKEKFGRNSVKLIKKGKAEIPDVYANYS